MSSDSQAPPPRVLVNTRQLPQDAPPGAVWSIAVTPRDLDSNVIWLPAGDSIAAHAGPDIDVLIHVLDGDGVVSTEDGEQSVSAGDLVFLPSHSVRGFIAGGDGLRYLTVHRKREASVLKPVSRSE